jgi:hypothetical protein
MLCRKERPLRELLMLSLKQIPAGVARHDGLVPILSNDQKPEIPISECKGNWVRVKAHCSRG